MDDQWLKDYILLVLRMDKAFHEVDSSYFLDNYYGPPELKTDIQDEPIMDFSRLSEIAQELQFRLPGQHFEPSRAEYLASHVQAMQTIAEIRLGTPMPFFEEVAKVFDIEPVWIPEEEFAQALKLIDMALPGKGDLRQRFQGWQDRVRLPAERSEQVLPVMQQMLDEARRRTNQLIELPDGESLDLQPVHGVTYGAANWYQGNYRSRLELNMDKPVYPFSLLYQMCHEGYPGHHTESCMKEKTIYRQKGYLEQSVFFALGPQVIIAEGIASLAAGMIFTPKEASDWIGGHVMPLVEPSAVEIDLERLLEAFTLVSGDDLGSNLSTLIEAGRTEQDVVDYALAYTPYSEQQVRAYLPALGTPLSRLYSFSYSHGARLIKPLLNAPNREQVIRRLLTEQITPSRLKSILEDID